MKRLFVYFALLFLSVTGVYAGGSQYYVEGYVTSVSNDETTISVNAFCGKNLTTTNQSSLKENTECLEKYARNKTMLQIVENYKSRANKKYCCPSRCQNHTPHFDILSRRANKICRQKNST